MSPPAKANPGKKPRPEESRDRRQNRTAEHDGNDGGKRRPGRDADNAGIGQRIAEQALHHGAGHGKPRPGQQPEQGARQAHGFKNNPILRRHGIGPARDIGDEIAETDGGRPGGEGHEDGGGKQHGQRRDDERGATRAVAGFAVARACHGIDAHRFTFSG